MTEFHANRCPDPEVLASYVDHGLSLTERSRVEAHLASCHQCVALVAGVVRTVAEISSNVAQADESMELAPSSHRLAGALAAAAAVFAIAVTSALVQPWLNRDAGLVSLVGSSTESRSVLGRLSGGYPHAPLGSPSAGGQDGGAANADRIRLIAGKIRESFGERRTPSHLHDLGVSQLLAGQYDEAERSLEAASRERPNNARYLNDVATVYLERARRGLGSEDLPAALAAADRARRLDPSLDEAWFNRALAVSSLSLTTQARAAWTEYLARDSASPWAAEARLRLDELSRPDRIAPWEAVERTLGANSTAGAADTAVRAHTTEARNFFEHELLRAWADAVEQGRDASPQLERLRSLADALERISEDSLYRDTVAAIDRAEAAGTSALTQLAAAHRQYHEAAAVLADDRFAAAVPRLEAARAALREARSVYALRAELDLCAAQYFIGNAAGAANDLQELLAVSARRSYPGLAARASWQLGLGALAQNRFGEAQTHYETTLATFERMGDVEQAAAAHNLLATLSDYLGDERTAWSHYAMALQALDSVSAPRLRYGILSSAATAARRRNPEAAILLQDSVIAEAQAWGRTGALSESWAQRAALHLALERFSDAESDLTTSKRLLEQVPDAALRSRIEVAVLATESDLLRRRDPEAAQASAAKAIAIVEARGDRIRLAQLNLKLARAAIAAGQTSRAEAALKSGLEAFEQERGSSTAEGRVSASDESWRLFEVAVQLAIEKGDHARAFMLAEQARARSIAEARQNPARSLADVQRALGDGEAVLALSQFEDELALWLIRRGGTTVRMRPLTRRSATALVARQQIEIELGPATPTASADLFNELIRPLSGDLANVSRVTIIPDAPYTNASFAAFWDRASRRFLVESHTLTIAPHASAVGRRASRESAGRPLVLGGPDPSAAAPARAVAAAYQDPELVTGDAATRSRLLSGAPSHSIVHLAARTSENSSYPLLSRVMLADEQGVRHSGEVTGSDIAAHGMPQTRLVVLDKVSGDHREGTLNLARAFMTAGVPAVLSTLPGADESATRELMVGFHRQLSSEGSAADALSNLQRNVLQSNGRRIGAWSSLVLYGSDR